MPRLTATTVLAAVLVALTAPVAPGADQPSPCRVKNVSQDTSGRSIIHMVEKAKDGDRLRVRGTCPGQMVIDVDTVIRGVGAQPTLTGRR